MVFDKPLTKLTVVLTCHAERRISSNKSAITLNKTPNYLFFFSVHLEGPVPQTLKSLPLQTSTAGLRSVWTTTCVTNNINARHFFIPVGEEIH